MIDLEEYLRELEEEDDQEQKDNVAYQENLFAEYVLRKKDRIDERQKLEKRFAAGEPVTGGKRGCVKNWPPLIWRTLAGHIFPITLPGSHLLFMRN